MSMQLQHTRPISRPARPLDGMRVLELGQLLAGPFAGSVYWGILGQK